MHLKSFTNARCLYAIDTPWQGIRELLPSARRMPLRAIFYLILGPAPWKLASSCMVLLGHPVSPWLWPWPNPFLCRQTPFFCSPYFSRDWPAGNRKMRCGIRNSQEITSGVGMEVVKGIPPKGHQPIIIITINIMDQNKTLSVNISKH